MMTTSNRWRLFSAVMAILAVVGWALHWHLTIVNNNSSRNISVLHGPMTAEKCYQVAQIEPSLGELSQAFGDTGDNTIIIYPMGDGRDCTITYWGGPSRPSAVSLGLA